MREPLLWPAVAVLIGIGGGHALAFSPLESAIAAAFFLILTVAARWTHQRLWWLPALAFVAAMGSLIESTARPGPKPHIPSEKDEVLSVQGCVVEPSSFFDGRSQFVVELEPGARAKVYQYPKEALTSLKYGQRVEFDARIRPPGSFDNPGGFNYPEYLARREIFWIATIPPAGKIIIQPGECGTRLGRTIAAARALLLRRIEEFFPHDDYASGMMQALLLGETGQVKRLWTEDFRKTGTFHALVAAPFATPIRAENPTGFTVKSALDDTKFSLEEHRGKTVVLHFLLKTECPYCLRYTREFAQMSAKTPNVIHVFLKPDSEAEIKSWVSHLDAKGLKALPTVYQDPDAKLAKQFGIPDGYKFHGQSVHFPALIAIDGSGKEAFRYVGKSNSDRMSVSDFTKKLDSVMANAVKKAPAK